MPATIVWMRRDLRLADQRAVAEACADGAPPVCVVTRPASVTGPVALRWRDAGVEQLRRDVERLGGSLRCEDGESAHSVAAFAAHHGTLRVVATADNTPAGESEQRDVRIALAGIGAELRIHPGQLAVEPSMLRSDGRPYRVFTPFWKAWRTGLTVVEADARKTPEVPGSAGEHTAQATLERFCEGALADYATARDLPAANGTSGLSAALAWGELGVDRVVASSLHSEPVAADAFVRQLAWRDFAYHTLAHSPTMLDTPLRSEFLAFPWVDDPSGLDSWKRGETGYPLVDAGMRQLAQTGWMHGRVRMVCASFLTKHLLIPWQVGAGHFEATLRDFDPAINAFNWQWVAGCGADAAPYFRIFNPALQARRYDPHGDYIRKWVPELANVEADWIGEPQAAPESALSGAGVRLGIDYPYPIIEHREARARALAAFSAIRGSAS
jgi:deoxyribodipyrimidine photo-lyase